MEKMGIYKWTGKTYKKLYETGNKIHFREYLEKLLSCGVNAEDIVISDGTDINKRLLEKLEQTR